MIDIVYDAQRHAYKGTLLPGKRRQYQLVNFCLHYLLKKWEFQYCCRYACRHEKVAPKKLRQLNKRKWRRRSDKNDDQCILVQEDKNE